jgi:hypothetical protein
MIGGEPDVALALTNTSAELGGRFRGHLVRSGELDDLADTSKSRVRGVRMRLQYRTEGRGTTDRSRVDEVTLAADDFGRVNSAFELVVPDDAPVSYDGLLIRVIWEIEVIVDIKSRIDATEQYPVLVLPTNGFGVYPGPHPLRPRRDR